MKICAACEHRFSSPLWVCPNCGWKADLDEFTVLAPGRAGFSADRFHCLAGVEESCFWFNNRNQLIIGAMDRFFPQAEKFMEVGCGTGFVLTEIANARKWNALVGAEMSVSGLRIARGRVPDAELIQMDICDCRFEEEFDLVGAFDVVEHIEQDVTALASLYRALSPGGGLLLTVPQHLWLWSHHDERAGHQRRYSRQELLAKLGIVGFEVVYTTSFTTFLLPLLMLSRFRINMTAKKETLCELSLPKAVNTALALASACERTMLRAGVTFPIGGSLLIAARKSAY